METIDEEDPCQGLWVYPEIMDIVALAAALALGMSTASLLSFSYEQDLAPADERYILAHEGLDSVWVGEGGEHPVSKGLMIFAVLASILSSFSLVLAVAVRILISYVISSGSSTSTVTIQANQRKFLLKWANPMAVMVLIIWVASVVLTAPTIYFVAWVAFPPEVANHKLLVTAGYMFLAAIGLMFLLGIYIVFSARRMAKQSQDSSSVKSTQQQQKQQPNNTGLVPPIKEQDDTLRVSIDNGDNQSYSEPGTSS